MMAGGTAFHALDPYMSAWAARRCGMAGQQSYICCCGDASLRGDACASQTFVTIHERIKPMDDAATL